MERVPCVPVLCYVTMQLARTRLYGSRFEILLSRGMGVSNCGELVCVLSMRRTREDRCTHVYEVLTDQRGCRTPSLARLAPGFPAPVAIPARMTRIRSLRRLLLPLALLGLLGTASPALACDGGTV